MEELIKSIYSSPEDWSIDLNTFDHSGGFKLWIAGGYSFCAPYKSGMNMTFFQKIRIWRAYKWWCANAPLSKVK